MRTLDARAAFETLAGGGFGCGAGSGGRAGKESEQEVALVAELRHEPDARTRACTHAHTHACAHTHTHSSNLTMNQTLEGHTQAVVCAAWNDVYKKV